MARRVALARSIALDPQLILYDDRSRARPDLVRRHRPPDPRVERFARRHLDHRHARRAGGARVVDYVYFMAAGRVIAQGTPDEIRSSSEPSSTSSSTANPRPGAVPLSAPDYGADLELAAA